MTRKANNKITNRHEIKHHETITTINGTQTKIHNKSQSNHINDNNNETQSNIYNKQQKQNKTTITQINYTQ